MGIGIGIGQVKEKGTTKAQLIIPQAKEKRLQAHQNQKEGIEDSEKEGKERKPTQKKVQRRKSEQKPEVDGIDPKEGCRQTALQGQKQKAIGADAVPLRKGLSEAPLQAIHNAVSAHYHQHQSIDQKGDLGKIRCHIHSP
jgi:hypothetical protein